MAEVNWIPCRSTRRKDLVQITEDNAIDVMREVGGSIRFGTDGEASLSVGGYSREVGQWVSRSGEVERDPFGEHPAFAPENEGSK